MLGNGDVYTWSEFHNHLRNGEGLATCMVARGALIKPWIFTEIKERRVWDISAPERLDMLRDFVHKGLYHWGADEQGVHIEMTRNHCMSSRTSLKHFVAMVLL